MGHRSSALFGAFARSRVRFIQTAPPMLSDKVSDQFYVPKLYTKNLIDAIPATLKDEFDKRCDVFWMGQHWKVPLEDDPLRVAIDVEQQLQAFTESWGCTAVTVPPIQLEWPMVVPPADGHLQTVVEQLRRDYPSDIFVPLDKDVHRRARVSPLGYLHRLATCFTTDDNHYVVETTTTKQDVVDERMCRMLQLLPEK